MKVAEGLWNEVLQAIDFAQEQFDRWAAAGTVRPDQQDMIRTYYRELLGKYDQMRVAGQDVPNDVVLPALATGTADAEAMPLWRFDFTADEVRKHEAAGRLSLFVAHECLADLKERQAFVRRRQRTDGRIQAGPKRKLPAAAPEPEPARPRRSVMEIVLDPHSIQWMLGLGGALFVVGLVIYLYTLGVFENPAVVAGFMGAGTLGLLGGGWALVAWTRHQLAGRALTLLACLVMPLNLWFYHAQGLLTLDTHLWLAALPICVLYAASARVLRDPTFVYVLVGGAALTGLLILADQHKFLEIAAPATLLVVLGLLAIHAERAFPDVAEGAFTRRRFGLAFFWSGHAVLGAGLLLLLGGQIFGGWLYEPVFKPLYDQYGFGRPEIVAEPWGPPLALLLVLLGTYAYVYSDVVVRRVGVYIGLAVFTLLWAEVLGLLLLKPDLPPETLVLLTLALTALGAHAVRATLGGRVPALARASLALGVFLSSLPVVLGVLLQARAAGLFPAWPYTITLSYVVAMALTALACRVGAHLSRREQPALTMLYFFGTAAATVVGAAALLTVLNVTSWDGQAPLLMLLPIAYLVASRLYRGHSQELPLLAVAHTATAVMLVASLGVAVPGLVVTHNPVNLTLALFFGEATVFYALAAAFRRRGVNVYLGTVMACAALWQLLNYQGVAEDYYLLTFAGLGLALLAAYRLAVLEQLKVSGLAGAAFQCAQALLSLAFLGSLFKTAAQLLHQAARHAEADWSILGLLLAMLAVNGLTLALVRQAAWRSWYLVTLIGQGAVTLLALHVLIDLTPAEKVELLSVLAGLVLVTAAHLGWYRENERQSELVSLGLLLGSVLIVVPLSIGTVSWRYYGVFSWPHELGLLLAALVLMASGLVCQLKWTTVTGAFGLVVYVVTLLIFIHWENVQIAALLITIGGGVLFGGGLLLSLYRDRLLALPEQVRQRQGVFKVLGWR